MTPRNTNVFPYFSLNGTRISHCVVSCVLQKQSFLDVSLTRSCADTTAHQLRNTLAWCPILKLTKEPTVPSSYRPIYLVSCGGRTWHDAQWRRERGQLHDGHCGFFLIQHDTAAGTSRWKSTGRNSGMKETGPGFLNVAHFDAVWFDHLPKYHMKMLLGDFNAKVRRENISKPTIGQESLHQDSNDNEVRLVKFATCFYLLYMLYSNLSRVFYS